MIGDTIFGITGHTTAAQECARAAVVFAYGVLLVRTFGRRVFGQWTAIDIVVAIVTGSSLSRALTGNADLFGTLAAVTLLFVLHQALARACARYPALSRWVEGSPVVLASGGRLEPGRLRRHGISRAAVEQACQAAHVDGLSGTRAVVLEPNGRITVIT